MRQLPGRVMLATTLAAVATIIAIAPQAASADTLTKVDGPAGCVADPSSTVPDGTCETAKGIKDATDVAISPDGKFLYAAATSSDSIAAFSRDVDSGELTQLPGTKGCIAAAEDPISGCATAHGLENPSALAISPDGKSVYVTTFTLDPGASPTPKIQGTLTTFSRNPDVGRVDANRLRRRRRALAHRPGLATERLHHGELPAGSYARRSPGHGIRRRGQPGWQERRHLLLPAGRGHQLDSQHGHGLRRADGVLRQPALDVPDQRHR